MSTLSPESRYFESGALTLHYLQWGNEHARPLVLIHHVSSQAHTWDRFAQSMSANYRVLALDLRGHGDSQWAGEGSYSTEHFASDVEALIQHLDLHGAIVLGGSLGGRVALVYAAQHPERVAALIMEDVGPVRPNEIAQRFAKRVAAGDPELETVAEWAEHLRGENQRTPTEFFLHNALHATKRLPNGKLGLKRDPALQRDLVPLDLWPYVDLVRAPLLLVLGAESTIVSPEQRDRLVQAIPDSQALTIEGAGHIVVHDRPHEFERAVRDFLRDHGL